MPPDGPREKFRPVVRIELPDARPAGFTAENTSGLSARELASLNAALRRLMAAGIAEEDAKLLLDAAVRDGLEPSKAGTADLQRWLDGGETPG